MIKNAVRAKRFSYYFAVSLIGLLFGTAAATGEKPAGDRDKMDKTQQDARLQSHWGYMGIEGPKHWAMLSPQYMTCEAGSKQSPINIHTPRQSNTQETLAFDARGHTSFLFFTYLDGS
jgi:carbonic anhydrase